MSRRSPVRMKAAARSHGSLNLCLDAPAIVGIHVPGPVLIEVSAAAAVRQVSLETQVHARADALICADLSFDERFETLGAMLPALSPTDLILPAMQGVSRR